jgi:hypothetical protein
VRPGPWGRPRLEALEERNLLSFSGPTYYPTGGGPFAVAVADFNNDGKLDLVTADGQGRVHVFLGNGDGTFGADMRVASFVGGYAVAVGDFNNDGTWTSRSRGSRGSTTP